MDHTPAVSIFNEIRERPYRVATRPGARAENCFFKGTELLQRLGTLGYAVRGRICETTWEEGIFPADIVALCPKDVLHTHFFIEASVDGRWRILDPSFHPAMAERGAVIGDFYGTPAPCFPVKRLYTHEENVRYQSRWGQEAYVDEYFRRCGPFLTRLNAWLETLA